MASTISNLSISDRNTDVPFFPNITFNFTNSDFGVQGIPTFSWIQAFFDSTFTGIPTLVVGVGYDNSGNLIVSQVRFAYSGERINIKGQGIYTTGTNIRGQTVTSTPIGSTLTTDLTQVIAYGGMN
jgi:hypothetical protein